VVDQNYFFVYCLLNGYFMKLFIPLILLFFVRGFSQPYLNTIEDFNLFISKQKFIKLEKGPYKIPEDTNQYFFVGKMIDGSYYFFYKHKVSSFKLNDTYEYKGDDEFNKKLQELKIAEPKDSVIIVKKENEKAYRDQTIIIYDTENKKTIKQKSIKVPYAERIDNKWVYLNPARIIWLDQNGNEIKRK